MKKTELKDRLLELRLERNLSQEQLAKQTGIYVTLISKWERGLNTPSVDSIITLVKFFGCTAGYLIGTED